MKRRTIGVLLVAAIFVCAAVGTVSAFMVKRGGNSDASPAPTFGNAEVTCAVTKETTDEKTVVKVQNTGNVAVYIRVQLVVNWFDSNGNLYYQRNDELNIGEVSGEWLRDDKNTFYHCKPVEKKGTITLSLGEFELGENITITETDEQGKVTSSTVYKPKLEIFAEAVQADPIGAAEDLWNVVIDANGTISQKATENS